MRGGGGKSVVSKDEIDRAISIGSEADANSKKVKCVCICVFVSHLNS